MTNEKVYQMDFNKVYQLLVSKAVKKGRTKDEVDQVTCWLTGYSRAELEGMAEKTVSYGDFFRNAPQLNENRRLIKGVVCGVRVEEIQEPLMQEIRYLDKLVDELARIGRLDVPNAIAEIRTAPVVHDNICDKTEMKAVVKHFLGVDA